ncbi:MAG: DUF2442 domain-containing protein [Gammaproteobacteria bacterium]|nr:DUF2442 domain-containing protein [Gammaproteobacteria bacterium]
MHKVTEIKALPEYKLWLHFDDGVEGTIDLSDRVGKGVFALWKDPTAFQEAEVGSFGEVMWGKTIDLCPDSLYLKVTGKKPEELFPDAFE